MPSSDPTLGDGTKAPTTLAWAPTPTLTEHWGLDAPAFVLGDAEGAGDAQDAGGARVAAGLARLGHPVELIAPRGPGGSTGRTAGPVYYPLVVHVGSVSAVAEPSAPAVARTVAAYQPGATITYDLGVRPALMGPPEEVRTRVEGLIARSDLVKASVRDLEWLWPGEERQTVVRRWLSAGPGIVIVSGGDGAWAVNAVGEVATSPGHPADDDQTDGAFMTGVIDALWRGGLLGVWARQDLRTLVWGSLKELLDNATAAAAIASRNHGQPPTRAELDAERGALLITA
ncbi:MAG: carbohydrate kinase family protein [Georgenia sp.]